MKYADISRGTQIDGWYFGTTDVPTKTRGTVMFDLDGVLNMFHVHFWEWAQPKYGNGAEGLKHPNSCQYDFFTDWGWTVQQFLERQAEFARSDGFERYKPSAIDQRAVQQISDAGYTVVFCTHRPHEAQDSTIRWARKYFPSVNVILFAQDKRVFTKYGEAPYFAIDDKVETVEMLLASWVHAFVMQQPYNLGTRLPRMESVAWFAHYLINQPRKTGTFSSLTTGEVTVTDPDTGGRKGTKPARFDLVPVRPLEALAVHYGKGAEKYEARNWEKGYAWSLSYAALQRHLVAWWNGEDVDAETGSSHLDAVAFHVFALREFMETHPEKDDRPNSGRGRHD